MAISVAPLVALTLDAKSVHAVIMQLEIEHESSQGETKSKADIKEYTSGSSYAGSADPEAVISVCLVALDKNMHHQAFYPCVPTPPPNA